VSPRAVARSRALVVAVALCGAAASPAGAQTAALAGAYVLSAAAGDDVEQAIGRIVDEMSFWKRPIARSRLRSTNQLARRISIAISGPQVDIVTDGTSIKTTTDGQPAGWTREDGERIMVSTLWKGGALERVFKAEDGERANTYRLGGDGDTMTVGVVVTSPQLPRPLAYRLVYRRVRG